MKNLFINNFFTEEEARQLLIEEGLNIEEIDSKLNEFLKKLQASELIIRGQIKKVEFEKNLKEFRNSDEDNFTDGKLNYSIAARKGEGISSNDDDEKLLDFIKKREKEGK
ncbi:MAG: hypothetical protein WHS65_14260 [Melioribacteraceae bacterium]